MHPPTNNRIERGTTAAKIKADPKRRPSISLIIPAWNEADSIAIAIEEASLALELVAARHEIIVVDDGSTDGTAQIVERISEFNDAVRLVAHDSNQGYGAAIRTGFAVARMELVAFTDADCQFDLKELDRFILLAKQYDVVCGYRIDRKDDARRCLYSRVYNLLVQMLLGLGVRDIDCALKVFRRDVTKALPITDNGFLVNTEMLTRVKQHGYSIVEVGVSHRPRNFGNSKISASHIPQALGNLVRFWWNEIQFQSELRLPAAVPKSQLENGFPVSWQWMQISLLVFATVFLLSNLGYPLIDCDETRYAEIPREMIATGNWILPQLNYQTYYDKPPLLYWLCAISYRLFGISETSARLVPALAALATLASTMFFASRYLGQRIGLASGIVLMLSVGFMVTSRYLLLDGLFGLFVSLSMFTAYEAIRGQRLKIGWWILSGVCIGLAFLTKGPLAVVLWLPPVLSMLWLSIGHAKPRWRYYAISFGIVAAIVSPWFVAVLQYDSTFWSEFFFVHNIARFAGEFHPKPIWYYLPVVLIAGHPWSFLLIPYVRFLFDRSASGLKRRPPALGFLLLWSAWSLVFFSMSKCKLPTYLLPAAPAMAIMMGHYLIEVLRETTHPARSDIAWFWLAKSALTTTCLAGVSIAVVVMVATCVVTPSVWLWAVIWILLLALSASLLHFRQQAKFAWGLVMGFAMLFSLMLLHQMLPTYSRAQTLFGETWSMSSALAEKANLPIATVQHEFSEVPFYLRRDNIQNFAKVDDLGLRRFIANNSHCILFVEHHVAPEDIHWQLPQGTKIRNLGNRGGAAIYETIRMSDNPRIIADNDADFDQMHK